MDSNTLVIPDQAWENVEDLLIFIKEWGECEKKKKDLVCICYGALWLIWKVRCDWVFKKLRSSPTKVADNVKTIVYIWLKSIDQPEASINSDGDAFLEIISYKPYLILEMSPLKYRGVDLVAGDWGSVGSVIIFNYYYGNVGDFTVIDIFWCSEVN
ncbi:hypothetical protein LXL04_011350 [Taraxacum kok-saghyz]